jgi:hypothetical protein
MEKSLVLSVSVGTGCYRHIQIGEDETLFRLHEAILDAFEFYDDHMHVFFMNNRAWDADAEFVCPCGDLDFNLDPYSDHERRFSDSVELSQFRLGKGAKFLYIFDFGDDWRFRIRVLRVIDEPTELPYVLKSVGQVSQYGFEDEDEDEEADF